MARLDDVVTRATALALTGPEQALTEQGLQAMHLLEAELRRRDSEKIKRYFLDTGPFRRELYPKWLAFFAAGQIYRERSIVAANRVGKTDCGSYELTLHLTGEYPAWWEGRRFALPIRAWACGTTGGKVKEIVQAKLIGPEHARGTGMIPARAIHHIQNAGGGQIDTVTVRHKSGGLSHLKFKSYEQGRANFEGTEQHVIFLDEEPPIDVYTECLLRTMATGSEFEGGILFMTFTPLSGVTEVVQRFMVGGSFPPDGVIPDSVEEAPR